MRKLPLVVGVLGPTVVGKTAVGVALARVLGVRVISCDSMQIYRGFPVLTDQPSLEEQAAAPHALVGVIDPRMSCTAAEYAALARPLIDEDLNATGRGLVVGGTGLYMRAALAPLAVAARADPEIRARLEKRAEIEGPEVLYAEFARFDPQAAAGIDPPQRAPVGKGPRGCGHHRSSLVGQERPVGARLHPSHGGRRVG